MQAKLRDGSVLIAGTCGRDAELKLVGDKGSSLCAVSVAVGKRDSLDGGKPETIWCNVKAWHGLAPVLARAKKGDAVFAVGQLEVRTYQDKQYVDLVAEFISLAAQERTAAAAPDWVTQAADGFDMADGILPF